MFQGDCTYTVARTCVDDLGKLLDPFHVMVDQYKIHPAHRVSFVRSGIVKVYNYTIELMQSAVFVRIYISLTHFTICIQINLHFQQG